MPQEQKRVTVIVTDLDNTLFDWMEIWYKPFKAMLDRLVADSGISQERLEEEFHQIHQQYGTAEYAFSIEQLPSLIKKHPGEDLTKVYASAIDAYRALRSQALVLYPQVEETLEYLKDQGCLLVGYTESTRFYTTYRMRKLKLDRLLDYLYSPPDHPVPANVIRKYPPDKYCLRRTIPRTTPPNELKPNPKLLLDILTDVGAVPEEAIYIGDSLMKDVAMAKDARITDVWAKYGYAPNHPGYGLLRRVTHWSAADVEREKQLKRDDVKPTYENENAFSEILQHFQFGAFIDRSTEQQKRVIEAWKKTIDVQQHFNDIEMRVRNYALTVLGGLFAVIGFGVKEHVYSWGLVGVLVAAVFLLYAFYFMDKYWYHRLLDRRRKTRNVYRGAI